MGGIEYAKVNFSYIDKETGEESFVGCPELGNIQLIPDTPLPPGDIFTLGYDPARGSLFPIPNPDQHFLRLGEIQSRRHELKKHPRSSENGLRFPEDQRPEDWHRQGSLQL